MDKKIFFEDARRTILDIFSTEFPKLNISDIDRYIGMFYSLVNYEEESVKIRPSILVTSSINTIVKNVPTTKKIVFYEDVDSSNLKKHLKALMCFCKKGWHIYINYGESIVEYGVIKTLNSLKDKSLIQLLNEPSTIEIINKKTSLIIIGVLGGGVCRLTNSKGHSSMICFNLNSQYEYNWEPELLEFVEACVSKIKTTKTKLQNIKNLILNIFRRVMQEIHGTICLVVDKDFVDSTGFLQDGTWLKDPIEFGKLFLRSNNVDENILRSYADVLTTMLDFDGITIIDNAGRIRAYNVFIESSLSAQRNVVGGARRRAAYTLLQSRNKKIVGVYFQSQDGDNFYKESNAKEKKKKIKIVDGAIVNNNDEMLPLEVIAQLQNAKKKEDLEKEITKVSEPHNKKSSDSITHKSNDNLIQKTIKDSPNIIEISASKENNLDLIKTENLNISNNTNETKKSIDSTIYSSIDLHKYELERISPNIEQEIYTSSAININ